jgi:hypothetical protein
LACDFAAVRKRWIGGQLLSEPDIHRSFGRQDDQGPTIRRGSQPVATGKRAVVDPISYIVKRSDTRRPKKVSIDFSCRAALKAIMPISPAGNRSIMMIAMAAAH